MRNIRQCLLLFFSVILLFSSCTTDMGGSGGECSGSTGFMDMDTLSKALFKYTGEDTIVLTHINDTLHLTGTGRKRGYTETFSPAGGDCSPNTGVQTYYEYYTITWSDNIKTEQLSLGHYVYKNGYRTVEVVFKDVTFSTTQGDISAPENSSNYAGQLNINGKVYNGVIKAYAKDKTSFVYINRENGILEFSLNNNTEIWSRIN